MREDTDCEEFLQFCRQYGEEIANSILEDICCEVDDRVWPFRLKTMSHETHDREGNNRTITGILIFRARAWMFKVRNGNWNGTEVREWEQCSVGTYKKLPGQSAWLFAPIEAVMVDMIVRKMVPQMSSLFDAMMNPQG